MPRRYDIKEEAKALGAAQIMIGLIHSTLGLLWVFLLKLEDKPSSAGLAAMVVIISYSFFSALFFINSGSTSVIQKVPSRSYRLTLAIIMNLLSVFMAIIGLLVLIAEFIIFESKATEYTWSNMTGMLLVQYLILSTVSELIIACVVVHWMRKAFHHQQLSEEEVKEKTLS